MKKKIQTDGVQELFEIVRAIQNGEEPEEAVQKKREARAEAQRQEILRQEEEAREEKQRREEEARLEKQRRQEEAQKRREARRKAREERAHGADAPDVHTQTGEHEADPERLREDDAQKRKGYEEEFCDDYYDDEPSEGSLASLFKEKALAFGERWKRSRAKRVKEPEDREDEENAFEDDSEEDGGFAHETEDQENFAVSREKSDGFADAAKESAEPETDDFDEASEADPHEASASHAALEWLSQGAQKITGAVRSISKSRGEQETVGSESAYAVNGDTEETAAAAEDAVRADVSKRVKSDEQQSLTKDVTSEPMQDADLSGENSRDEDAEDSEAAKKTAAILAAAEHAAKESEAEVSEPEGDSAKDALADDESQHKGWILEEDMAAAVEANRRAPIEDEPERVEQMPGEADKDAEDTKKERKKRELPHISIQGAKDCVREMKTNLTQRGFGKKEGGMLAAGLVLAVLIVALIVNAITASVERRKKMEHVKADKGLEVTVEKEPQAWSRSYPIVLGVRVKGEKLEKVEVNGKDYKVDDNGLVVVKTSDYLLELVAKKGKETLKAQIEIPKLDAQPPVVNVVRDGDSITATGADNRSEIAHIWYAEVHKGDLTQIPLYKKYSKPLTFEENTTYYFYAQDKAGNSGAPVVTTMEAPESISFGQAQISLFPGETSYLELQVKPELAILNNLKYESANPEIATVDGSGAVTAVSEGSTIIHVSAEGVKEIACPVTVSSSRTVTISAVGDCTLGSDASFNTSTNFDAFAAVNGTSYFFENVKDILENDDATFANFEGTLTTVDTRENKQYAFKGDPSYTQVLDGGSIDVVTLANNHSSDYGAQSHSDTKKYLTEAGIDYCTGDEIAIKDVNGIRTAFIGIYVLDEGLAKETQVQETIAAAKAQGAQLVVVAFHWGSEKATEPDATQITLAHAAVDAGADLVVGHHPHVLQGIEKYNGKYIAYSLGNFCFGGNNAPSDMDTIIFRQTFTVTKDGVGADAEVEIIPCLISSAEGYNNYQPTPAQGEQADRIMERLNEYSSAYGQTFEASTGVKEGVQEQSEGADAA